MDRIPAMMTGIKDVITAFGSTCPIAAMAAPAFAVPKAAPMPTHVRVDNSKEIY